MAAVLGSIQELESHAGIPTDEIDMIEARSIAIKLAI
jgi:hypothetical protein